MKTKRPIEAIRADYEKIKFPEDVRDNWVARAETFDRLLVYGSALAWQLTKIEGARDHPAMRPYCPELFDLIVASFEPEHPSTIGPPSPDTMQGSTNSST